MEVKDKKCRNSEWYMISSLVRCQYRCEQKPGCVGISYDANVGNCYTCYDDELVPEAFNFYRKPGKTIFIFQIYSKYIYIVLPKI